MIALRRGLDALMDGERVQFIHHVAVVMEGHYLLIVDEKGHEGQEGPALFHPTGDGDQSYADPFTSIHAD